MEGRSGHGVLIETRLGNDHPRSDEEREYRTLMRKWWFGAAVGAFTMIFSYPWLIPGLREWLPRGSESLRSSG